MRTPKIILGIWLVIFSLAIGGCNWFENPAPRPAPTRPRVTPAPNQNVRPAPTKRIPGISSVTEQQLRDRINKIETACKKEDWNVANSEVNKLGIDMTRYRPTSPKGRTLREMPRFDAIYAKLQVDAKTRNKAACLKDAQSLENALNNMQKNSQS